MKVQSTNGHQDDHTADMRAEGLREDFDQLRTKIEEHPTLSEGRKNELLDQLESYDKLLLEREDDAWRNTENSNDVGFADESDASLKNFDQFRVIRREYNQAVDGFRRISKEFRAAAADAPGVTAKATATATATIGEQEVKLTASAETKAARIGEVVSVDIDPPESIESEATDSPDAPSESSRSGEGDSIGSLEFDGMSVDEMLNGLNDDPQAVMDHIQGLDAEDKQMAMQMLQQRLQQINQMFSMISNLMKTAHSTAKAAINNMRV